MIEANEKTDSPISKALGKDHFPRSLESSPKNWSSVWSKSSEIEWYSMPHPMLLENFNLSMVTHLKKKKNKNALVED